jgi:dsDNA-specific endonuclease/ATPase MutS2
MKFKIGDRVEALDQDIEGSVTNIKNNEIIVETSDGFLLSFQSNEILLKNENSIIKITNQDIENSKNSKDFKIKKQNIDDFTKIKTQYKQQEVDLHIDKLIKNYKHLSNFEILNHQLKIAKNHLDNAIQNKVQKIVFIHGVGTGVLRSELEYLFQKYENTNFQDADYSKYGNGAVEIYFKQIAFKTR